MHKTIKFSAVIGVNAGYGHNNEGEQDAVSIVGKVWQDAAKEVFSADGVYISAVCEPSKTVYNTDWGCPVGGELTVAVYSTANPAFVQDIEAWKQAVIRVVKIVKTQLHQSTVAIEFCEVNDFIYLTDED